MVLNDRPTRAAVRLCCRAAARSNRGTRSSGSHRGGAQPRPTVRACALDALYFSPFLPFFSLFPSIPRGRTAQRDVRRRPAAQPPPLGRHGKGVACGPNVAGGDVTQCSPPHHTAEGRPECRHLTPRAHGVDGGRGARSMPHVGARRRGRAGPRPPPTAQSRKSTQASFARREGVCLQFPEIGAHYLSLSRYF